MALRLLKKAEESMLQQFFLHPPNPLARTESQES